MIGSMYEYIEEHSYDEMVRKCINEYGKYGRHRVLKEICRKLDVDMRTARSLYKKFGITYDEWKRKSGYQADIAGKEQKLIQKQAPFLDMDTIRCPKCGSASISYVAKPKFHSGRAVIGALFGGLEGSFLMGVTGKNKQYAVCMNCGKKWKIRRKR